MVGKWYGNDRGNGKVMLKSQAREQKFMIGSKPPESLQKYVYLGQLVIEYLDHATKIYRRIKMGWGAYNRHYQVRTSSLPLSLKRKVHNIFDFFQYLHMGQKLGG